MREKIYEWMVNNLPFRLMYRKVPFDGAYLWIPRWGWPKSYLKKAEKRAEEWMEKLKWD